MFLFKHGGRRAAIALQHPSNRRQYASKIEIPFTPPPFPVIESCPAPTCPCREPPPDLDIEREQNINGSMATYGQQVLVSTGRNDWKSKIEDDDEAVLVRQLRKFLTRGGRYVDPYHNVMITNSSFPPTSARPATHTQRPTQRTTASPSNPVSRPGKDPDIGSQKVTDSQVASAFLLPSFQYLPTIPTEDSAVEAFIKAFILPQKLHAQHDLLSRTQKNLLLREPERQREFIGARKIDEILVLICGHGGRDDRCGKLGPVLRDEFVDKLQRQNVAILEDAPVLEAREVNTEVEGYVPTARVGLISHIGGHKWAGNVIVYVPPSFSSNPLAGKGIWYGRVGPEHVEGIVSKTIMDGKVIKDLFRGGIDRSGEILRL